MHRLRGHPYRILWFSGVVAYCALAGLRLAASQPESSLPAAEKAASEVERAKATRRANALPVSFIAPFYSVANDDESTIFLLNRFSDPIAVNISSLGERGESLPVGDYVVPPARHIEIPLDSLRARSASGTASLILTFKGDADMLQGWVVVRRGSEVEEFPLHAVGNGTVTTMTSYWAVDSIHRPSSPVYFLFNAGLQATHVEIHLSPGDQNKRSLVKRLSRTIGPGRRVTFSPFEMSPDLQRGTVTFSHDGDPGSLLITGVLQGSQTLVSLPIVESAQSGTPSEYYGIQLPIRDPLDGGALQSALVVFNPGVATESVQVSVLEQISGRIETALQARLEPGEIRVLDLTQAIAAIASVSPPADEELGLRVTAPGDLLVSGVAEYTGGGVKNLAIMAKSSSHGSGMYPLPPTDRFEVVTTLINVGTEPSRLVAQISWDNGSYSLPPLDLMPGQGLSAEHFKPRKNVFS
jgi:hypothetical protein